MKKEINDEKRCKKGERGKDRSPVELGPHRGNQKIIYCKRNIPPFEASF